MDKSFLEALKKVKGKQLDEAMTVPGTKPNPSPNYGFAGSGSDSDTAANFFTADKKMKAAQTAAQQTQQAAPVQRPKPTAPSASAPAAPMKFKGSISDFQKANPGATVGQAMNAIQGKTAITGGKNDPSVIAQQRSKDSEKGPVQPVYNPGSTTMRKGEVAGQVADRNTEPGYSGSQGANLMKDIEASKNKPTAGSSSGSSSGSSGPTGSMGLPTSPSSSDTPNSSGPGFFDRIFKTSERGYAPSPAPSASIAVPEKDQAATKGVVDSVIGGDRQQMNKAASNAGLSGDEEESGGRPKGKKKMSESMIDSFLKLQATGASNMFEAAKKAKKDWDKDGKIESEKDEVWGSRFAAAKKAGKMEEGVDTSPIKKSTTSDPDFAAPSADPDAPKSPITFKANTATTVAKSTNEEVSFSASELAHFEAVIARKDMKGKENALNPTVDSANLTDEYVVEMARGVKAGTKRGSYKKKATDLAGNKVASADAATDESDKGIPHVLDQIRSAKENETGHITLKDHDSDPANPKTGSVHRKVARDFYSDYHNTEKPADKNAKLAAFKSKVFG